MDKYSQIYTKPYDKLWYIGEKNCTEKAVSSLLKVRHYNDMRLLKVFLDDITVFIDSEGKTIKNTYKYKKIYTLQNIRFAKDIPVENLKYALDMYGEVIIITSTNALPYKAEYDMSVFNPDKGKHTTAIIGYDKDYFYFLESVKYIGQGYVPLSSNHSIGKCHISDLKICLDEYFECMNASCDLDKTDNINAYADNTINEIGLNRNKEDKNGYYGLSAIKRIYTLFEKYEITHDFYSDSNIMEITRIMNSRNVMKYYINYEINESEKNNSINDVFDEDIKYWTKFMRIVMRRKSNKPDRQYDNSDVCDLIKSIYKFENFIYDSIAEHIM